MSNFLTIKKSFWAAITAAALIGIAGLCGSAIAAPKTCDDGSRPPCDGGGGDVTTPDYGDLIILLRDDWGVPIVDANMCQQPIGFPDPDLCPEDGLLWNGEVWLVPTDPDTCAIDIAHAACTDEADFGRTNTARSSDTVLESQLEDVIIGLAIADCTTLDAAGRMVHSRVDDLLVTNTIDSPLQNLSVYKHLMRDGTIGVPLPEGASPLQTAARGLGVAMDKAGAVNMDLLVYLNEFLGLTEGTTILEYPTCIDVKQEVMGNMQYGRKVLPELQHLLIRPNEQLQCTSVTSLYSPKRPGGRHIRVPEGNRRQPLRGSLHGRGGLDHNNCQFQR